MGDRKKTIIAFSIIFSGLLGFGVFGSQLSFAQTPSAEIYVIGQPMVGMNLQKAGYIILDSPAPAGGVQLELASSDDTKLLLSDDRFLEGSSVLVINISEGLVRSNYFYFQSLSDSGQVTVSGTDIGSSGISVSSKDLDIVPSGFSISFPAYHIERAHKGSFSIYVVPNANGTSFTETQYLRAGYTIGIPLNLDDASLGTFSNNLVTIQGGNIKGSSSFTSFSPGVGEISISQPAGYIVPEKDGSTLPQGTTFEITNPTSQLNGFSGLNFDNIGFNLQKSFSVQISAPAPAGGQDITVQSSDPTKLIISDDRNIEGPSSGSITVTIPEGFFAKTLFAQGLADSGVVTLSISGPNIIGSSGDVVLRPSGFWTSHPYSPIDTNTLETGRTGSIISGLTPTTLRNYPISQEIRGGYSIDVSLSNSNSEVIGTDSPITFSSARSFESFSYEPLSEGTSTIGVQQPIGFSIPQTISGDYRQELVFNVNQPRLFLNDISVGKDLQINYYVNSEERAPIGGIPVTLESSDPSKLLLSTDRLTPGSQSINVLIPQYYYNTPSVYLQALDGSGSVTLTATAPGFDLDTSTVNLTPSGFTIEPETKFIDVNQSFSPIVKTYQLDSSLEILRSGNIRAGEIITIPITNDDPITLESNGVDLVRGASFSNPSYKGISIGDAKISITQPIGFQIPHKSGIPTGQEILVNVGANDADGDGIFDIQDNCPNIANIDQNDLDNDGDGDVCDVATIPTFTIHDLGTPGGTESIAVDVNENGIAAGWGKNSFGGFVTVAYDTNTETLTELCPNGSQCDFPGLSNGWGINNEDKVTGTYLFETAFVVGPGDIRQDLEDLEGLKSRAFDINNNGLVVGQSETIPGFITAVKWENGQIQELGAITPGYQSQARKANDLGQIVGNELTGFSNSHTQWALLWDLDGSIIPIGTLGGSDSQALDINEDGKVTGWARDSNENSKAFLWDGTQISDLGTLGCSASIGNGINDKEYVVGLSCLSTGENRGFFWSSDTGMLDLGTLGGPFSEAKEISDNGIIVGQSRDSSGEDHAVYWTINFNADGDNFDDSSDNCKLIANNDQADFDSDGIGDACDRDDDNDGIEDQIDVEPNNDRNRTFDSGFVSGRIYYLSNPPLTVLEESSADGIRVISPPGAPKNYVESDCESGYHTINPETEILLTCGSETVEVLSGPIESQYILSGQAINIILHTGDKITFDSDAETITNHGENPIDVYIGGFIQTIGPLQIESINLIPTSDPNGPYVTAIDTPLTLDGSGSSDPENAPLDYLWSAPPNCSFDDPTLVNPKITCLENAGVFEINLEVEDPFGAIDSKTVMVVVYDPEGGFVSGAGWINSPEGSCNTEAVADVCNYEVSGKATFGFVSKYQKGATEPSGNTQFYFKAGNLKFKSSDYEWLTIVIAGAKAQYKGTGTINGEGDYGFILTAFDADYNENDNHLEDKFRIKIWDKTNGDEIVYDNKMGESDDYEDATIIGGGSIQIHKAK